MAERAGEVLAALRARISEQGDMHISVSHRELDALREALGIGWWENADDTREIDAMALEMLIVAAENRRALASEREAIGRAAGREEALREEPIVAPPNGEPDPEWRAIRRAIDQFVGRVPTISKHRAVHCEHLRQLVERLDAAGDREAADTIVWQAWYRALDRERERFLLDDARALPVDGGKDGAEEVSRGPAA